MSSLRSSERTDGCRSGRTVPIAVLIVATLLSGGCRGDASPGAGEEDSDSASDVEQWSLSEVPLLEIGVVEGDPVYQLHEAVSSVRLPDGRVAVVNAGSQEIRFYSAIQHVANRSKIFKFHAFNILPYFTIEPAGTDSPDKACHHPLTVHLLVQV